MKQIILTLCVATLLMSCKPETKQKLEEAKDAVTSDVKASLDSAKVKAKIRLDSIKENAKTKMDSIKLKSANTMEEAAKNLKETVKD
jgi:F0F1-type ATP synthase membrane subunit b/b'